MHDAKGPSTSETIFTHLSKLFSEKSPEPALLIQFKTKKCLTGTPVEIVSHALFHRIASFLH